MATATKTLKVVRRNLPINDKYTIVNSFYTGGLLDNPMCCANCGKAIANVAEIKNSKGDVMTVGMDCAATLSSLSGLMYGLEAEFAEAKGIRAKVNKQRKAGETIQTEITAMGEIVIRGGHSMAWISQEFFKRFFPDLMPTLVNPDKMGFKAVEVKISGPITRDRFATPEYFKADGITAKVYYGKTVPHGHGIFCIEVDGKEDQTYNIPHVQVALNLAINKKRLLAFK